MSKLSKYGKCPACSEQIFFRGLKVRETKEDRYGVDRKEKYCPNCDTPLTIPVIIKWLGLLFWILWLAFLLIVGDALTSWLGDGHIWVEACVFIFLVLLWFFLKWYMGYRVVFRN